MPTKNSLFKALAAAALSLGLSAAAWADPPEPAAPEPAAEDAPPPGFERVKGAPETEKVDANKLVIAAYAAFFFGLFGYVVYVGRQQRALAEELASLEARMPESTEG